MPKPNTVTITLEIVHENKEQLADGLSSLHRHLYHLITGQASYMGQEKPFAETLSEQRELKISFVSNPKTTINHGTE